MSARGAGGRDTPTKVGAPTSLLFFNSASEVSQKQYRRSSQEKRKHVFHVEEARVKRGEVKAHTPSK